MSRNRVYSSLIAMTGTALLCSGMALAQAAPGGGSSNSSRSGSSPRQTQDPTGAMNASSMGGQAAADKTFVSKALMGGMAEVQMGKLASEKGSSDAVKNFGQKMVDDHTKMGDDMKPIAQKLGVPVPTHIDAKDQALYGKLQAMSGTAFDTAYIKAMVKDHKKDQADFKMEAQNAADPDLKQAATNGEKIVSEHLQMIEDIAKSSNVASK